MSFNPQNAHLDSCIVKQIKERDNRTAICKILEIPGRFHRMTVDDVAECARFANAAGALVTAKKGAIPAFPDRATIDRFFRELKYRNKKRFF